MIEARNIVKTYETKVRKGLFKKEKKLVEAVKGIDIRIEPGKIVGLLGLNGAGKTTTIKMLSTLLEPTEGEVRIDGVLSSKNPMQMKQQVNMIAGGERMIYWRLTGKENLWYFGQLYGIEDKVLNKRIETLLALVGLVEHADTPVERYSKGMKQRLQIARGLINDPDYLFMDEPTLGLDAPIAKEIRSYVRGLAVEQKKGILLTSHYINEVEELCDYIYVLDKGEIILEGTAEELSAHIFDTKETVLELSHINDSIVNRIQGLTKNNIFWLKEDIKGNVIRFESREDITAELVSFIQSEKLPLSKLYSELPKLEDTIIELSRRVR